MKLWQKIFLPTLTLLVLCTALVSTILLKASTDAMWQREGLRAVTQQQYLAGMLRAGVVSHRLQRGVVQLGAEETAETVRQVLGQQALDSYLTGLVLLDGDGTALHDSLPDSLGDALPQPPEDEPGTAVYELRPGVGEGEWYLVCAMPVTLESGSYRLGAAYFVGDLQQALARQAAVTVVLCLGVSLVGAAGLLILVSFLFRPLAALDKSARRIAGGHYGERVAVRGRDELAGLAQDMNDMAQAVQDRVEQLERAAEERKMFVANLAHEMKTPLTSILGFADLLYLPRNVPEETRVEYARVISDEAKRLRSLSGKLLELATLGSAAVLLSPGSVKEAADEAAVSLTPVLAHAGLTLDCDCAELTIDMDRELFKSLLYNLLDNGRKASPRGATLRLTAREENGDAVIRVEDRGHGIPPGELEKVLQPFYMVDKSRSRKAGGAGLGLALCREIASLHRGTLDIQSEVGQGTIVTLRFPCSGVTLDAEQEGGEADAET